MADVQGTDFIDNENEPKLDRCPRCNSRHLWGPSHDFWGISCVECGWSTASNMTEVEVINGN
jgi:hypothetical protein